MEKLFTGRDGYMQVGDSKLLKVTAFTIQGELNLLETTTLSDNVKTYIPGQQSFSGSANVIYYKGPDDGANPSVDTVMRSLIKAGSSGITTSDRLNLRFFFSYTGTARQIRCNAYITNVSIGANVGEVVTAQISFTCDGPLEEVTL